MMPYIRLQFYKLFIAKKTLKINKDILLKTGRICKTVYLTPLFTWTSSPNKPLPTENSWHIHHMNDSISKSNIASCEFWLPKLSPPTHTYISLRTISFSMIMFINEPVFHFHFHFHLFFIFIFICTGGHKIKLTKSLNLCC